MQAAEAQAGRLRQENAELRAADYAEEQRLRAEAAESRLRQAEELSEQRSATISEAYRANIELRDERDEAQKAEEALALRVAEAEERAAALERENARLKESLYELLGHTLPGSSMEMLVKAALGRGEPK